VPHNVRHGDVDEVVLSERVDPPFGALGSKKAGETVPHRRGHVRGAEIPYQADAEAAPVVLGGVEPDDARPAIPSLVDVPVHIDEVVVADVPPLARNRVVIVYGPHHYGRIHAALVCDGMVDDDGLHRLVLGRGRHEGLVRAPCRARDHWRHALRRRADGLSPQRAGGRTGARVNAHQRKVLEHGAFPGGTGVERHAILQTESCAEQERRVHSGARIGLHILSQCPPGGPRTAIRARAYLERDARAGGNLGVPVATQGHEGERRVQRGRGVSALGAAFRQRERAVPMCTDLNALEGAIRPVPERRERQAIPADRLGGGGHRCSAGCHRRA